MNNTSLHLALFAALLAAPQAAGAQESELTVAVTLATAGSLGTELLALPDVDHIKNVVNLTVSGPMNDDDWATLRLIDALTTLDLSQAQTKSIPENQFNGYCQNLTIVKLPDMIETVGSCAFSQEAKLTTINWPAGAKRIPNECFYRCYSLEPFDIPEGVTTIDYMAFSECGLFKSDIPQTIAHLGHGALSKTSMEDVEVVIPEGAYVGDGVFSETLVKAITFPSTYYRYSAGQPRSHATLTFKSPTMMLDGYTDAGATLRVPHHLLNSYKLDAYWGRWAKVEAFPLESVTDVTTWLIQTDFDMTGGIRMEGAPNVSIAEGVVLTVSGDDAQHFGDFSFSASKDRVAQLMSTTDGVTVGGTMAYSMETEGLTWQFMSLPFDFKVGDITTQDGAKLALRTYDGANRAQNWAATDNWKSASAETMVKAGEGFIVQTNHDTRLTFKAQDNETRNNALAAHRLEYALQANGSTRPEHKGWNLVGNPWQTFYDIRQMDYAAPISVFEDGAYNAYSARDDDYVLRPNQAFFVQCPDTIATMAFPTEGRLTSADTGRQDAARATDMTAGGGRRLVDVVLSDGSSNDRTRLVLNPQAEADYELDCDAAKFFATDGRPQLYTMEQDVAMAINERPEGDGTVKMGLRLTHSGSYTLSATRCTLADIVLVDLKEDTETPLAEGQGYTFTAQAGTCEDRFMLRLDRGEATAIDELGKGNGEKANATYDLQGRRTTHATAAKAKGVHIVNGRKVMK